MIIPLQKKIFTFILGISLISVFNNTIAQDGLLDLSFNGNGFYFTAVGESYSGLTKVAIQNDGKIIGLGSMFDGDNGNSMLIRFNIDGSIDESFGEAGFVYTDLETGIESGSDLVIQNDQKIIVASRVGVGFFLNLLELVRYDPNGNIDLSFGTDGYVITDLDFTFDQSYSIAMQNDGKIIIGTTIDTATDQAFGVLRYNSNGSLDTTFGNDGLAIALIGTNNSSATDVAIQDDGKIIVGGYTWTDSYEIALARFTTSGVLDTSFDTDGKIITSLGSSQDYGKSIAIQEDQKILVAGYTQNGTNSDIALVCYNPNGSLDQNFANGGIYTSDTPDEYESVNSLVIQPDGKILITGKGGTSGDAYDFLVAKYLSNGILDSSFGTDGLVTTSITGYNDFGRDIQLQSDGKIVVGGACYNELETFDVAIARYTNSGATDIIQLNAKESLISIYPNPCKDYINISSDILINGSMVKIYNSLGDLVKEINQHSTLRAKIHTGDLKCGLYTIVISNANGLLSSQQFMKYD